MTTPPPHAGKVGGAEEKLHRRASCLDRIDDDPRKCPLREMLTAASTEKECAMSTYYSSIKKIPGDDVFDGRLEEFGIREHIEPGQTTNTYRCLSDGHDYVWVRMDGNGFFWSVRGLSGILYTVADVFETEIVSEHQAQFWGFDTQEEWDAKLDQMAKESEEKFQVSVVNY